MAKQFQFQHSLCQQLLHPFRMLYQLLLAPCHIYGDYSQFIQWHPTRTFHQILIGADYYWKFVQDTIVRGGGPIAQESKLGYLLSGPLPCSLSQSAPSILLQITSTVVPQQPSLEKFWSIKNLGTTDQTPSLDLVGNRHIMHLYLGSIRPFMYVLRLQVIPNNALYWSYD